MSDSPRSMIDMNDLVAGEFRRIHGCDSALALPRWWAMQVRAVILLQDQFNGQRAAARWAELTRRQQQDRLIVYLERLPAAGSEVLGRLIWPTTRATPAR